VTLDKAAGIPSLLRALAAQTVPPEAFEVAIEGDVPAAEMERHVEHAPRVTYEHVPHGCRAAYRNRGLARTHAPVAVFLADDFVPAPAWLEHHLRLHERRPEETAAGIGPGLFTAAFRDDPFMRWLEDSGSLFGVSFTRPDPRRASFFYGANVSVKRRLLDRAGPFDERFRHHAWDDYEMGRRLFALGMTVDFLPDASCIHEHDVTFDERSRAVGRGGESAAVFEQLHPPPHPWRPLVGVSAWRLGLRVAGARLRALATGSDAARGALYQALMDRAFVAGYRRGAADR